MLVNIKNTVYNRTSLKAIILMRGSLKFKYKSVKILNLQINIQDLIKQKGSAIYMKIDKEELLHIANLADLNLKEEEIDNYLNNLQDILNFTDVISKAPIDELEVTIGENTSSNVFRKDEIKTFDNHEGLMKNAPDQERGMFKIPKVIQ